MDESRPSLYERDIGAAYVLEDSAWLARHAEFGGAPKGTGDLLTAMFTACRLQRMRPRTTPCLSPWATGRCGSDAIDRGNGDAPELRLTDFPTEFFASQLGDAGSRSMSEPPIGGLCPPRFEAVRRSLRGSISAEGLELGARFALAIEGEIVVDLMGGWADRAETRPFAPTTR